MHHEVYALAVATEHGTISEEYRLEQRRLHLNPHYGVASLRYAELVRSLLEHGRCKSLSDYGAGKCNLRVMLGTSLLGIDYFPYDPAFPEYGAPKAAELVACIDVLEHVEPALLDRTLDELASITARLALLTVHTGPAKKSLSDGRNAHLTQEPASWWLPKLSARFDVLALKQVRKGFFAIICPKELSDEIEAIVDLPAILQAAARCNPRPGGLARRWAVVQRKLPGLWAATRRATAAVGR